MTAGEARVLETIAERAAFMALAEVLQQRARSSGAIRVEARSPSGWSVTVTIDPPPGSELPELSSCERDILTVLASAPMRWSTTRILEELDRRGLLHGESTVKRALARLVREGLLSASKRAPRGYRLSSVPASLPVSPSES